MAPEHALHAFARACTRGGVQLAIVAFDRNGAAESGFLEKPLFSRLAAEFSPRQPRKTSSDEGLSRKRLLAAAPAERQRLVTEYLRDLVATQTGFAKAKLDVHRPLTSFGLDSLMTLKLKNRVETSFGVSIPVTFFLQGATTVQLASRIVASLDQDGVPATAAPVAPVAPSPAATRAAQRKAAQARRVDAS